MLRQFPLTRCANFLGITVGGNCTVVRVKGAQAGILIAEYHPHDDSNRINLRVDKVDPLAKPSVSPVTSEPMKVPTESSVCSIEWSGHIEMRGDLTSKDAWPGNPNTALRFEGFLHSRLNSLTDWTRHTYAVRAKARSHRLGLWASLSGHAARQNQLPPSRLPLPGRMRRAMTWLDRWFLRDLLRSPLRQTKNSEDPRGPNNSLQYEYRSLPKLSRHPLLLPTGSIPRRREPSNNGSTQLLGCGRSRAPDRGNFNGFAIRRTFFLCRPSSGSGQPRPEPCCSSAINAILGESQTVSVCLFDGTSLNAPANVQAVVANIAGAAGEQVEVTLPARDDLERVLDNISAISINQRVFRSDSLVDYEKLPVTCRIQNSQRTRIQSIFGLKLYVEPALLSS